MAPCAGVLVWRTPWTEEPGRLQSTGKQSRAQVGMAQRAERGCSSVRDPGQQRAVPTLRKCSPAVTKPQGAPQQTSAVTPHLQHVFTRDSCSATVYLKQNQQIKKALFPELHTRQKRAQLPVTGEQTRVVSVMEPAL